MKAGRNDPCPCGSGKKYKKCCLAKDQAASLTQTGVVEPPPSSVAPARLVPSIAQQHPQTAAANRTGTRRRCLHTFAAARSHHRARR